MPDTIPEFALQSTLSRPLTTQSSVLWEKVMLELQEALQVDKRTDDALLHAMLALHPVLGQK